MGKKIAIPVDNDGLLDAHFGHCRYFTIITEENADLITREQLIPPPHEPGVLPAWLAKQGVTDVIAGGMGKRAIDLFNHHGVNVFVGAPQIKDIDLVKGFLAGNLDLSANYCDH